MSQSVLTKKQAKTFTRVYTENGTIYTITATVRYDDQCNNGHNTFGITGEIRGPRGVECCGCLHEDIAKRFPELAPLIKWHLCSSDGPLHYVANTVYHAESHPANKCWISCKDVSHPLKLSGTRYMELSKANEIAAKYPNCEIKIDEKTEKIANFIAARSTAIWPEATDEQLSASEEELTAALNARLPGLLAEFREAVESFGFTF
jgi:hypothetical protein